MTQSGTGNSTWRPLYIIGGIAALLQLASILALLIVMATLGPKPTNAEEYFTIQQSSRLESILRGDFLLLILMDSYLGTISALYVTLRRVNPAYSALATLMKFIPVVVCSVTESTFWLQFLGELIYTAAAIDLQCARFLAAGEAVIASDMWHSSGAYMSGILLQGGGIIIALVMLRRKDFSKVTAYAGLMGNGLKLGQGSSRT
jgi:hypothetical protein